MTLEASIFDTLKGLVGNRVFPDVAPYDTPMPYITYQQIGGQSVNYVDDAIPDSRNAIVQFNGWDATRSGAAALAKQIEDALRAAAAFTARPVSEPISQHEPGLERYGTLQDFSIWADR